MASKANGWAGSGRRGAYRWFKQPYMFWISNFVLECFKFPKATRVCFGYLESKVRKTNVKVRKRRGLQGCVLCSASSHRLGAAAPSSWACAAWSRRDWRTSWSPWSALRPPACLPVPFLLLRHPLVFGCSCLSGRGRSEARSPPNGRLSPEPPHPPPPLAFTAWQNIPPVENLGHAWHFGFLSMFESWQWGGTGRGT